MKHTQEQLDTMRKLLAERDVEQSNDRTMFDFSDEHVAEEFAEYFGEDYFDVVDEKDHKNGLYGQTDHLI